ncbi:MAG: VCBS repeat-containing protein [Anaerolineae bacterium]|nr:VCBS repeat-containing protein [Anaerolineae bacterium]
MTSKTIVRIVILSILLLLLGFGLWQVSSPSHAATMERTIVPLSGERIKHGSAGVADFDGDGYKEIVIGGPDGMLYVVAHNGSGWSVVWSRQVAGDLNANGAPASCADTTQSDIRSAPAIGDLTGDGTLEIVVTTGGDPGRSGDPGTAHRNGGVLVYTYKADSPWEFSLVPGWPMPKLDIIGLGAGASDPDGCWDGIWGSPALSDIDGDSDLEIIVEGFDRRLHVYHHDGTYVDGWPIGYPTVYRGGWASPAVGDLDQDGLPEIIFATDSYPKKEPPYLLFAFNGDGTILPGFPVEAEQNMQSSPALGDIDGDGWLDIVVGTGTHHKSTNGNRVYAWDHEGNLLDGWPKITGGNMPASPALGDIDGDGELEVVIGCGSEPDGTCQYLYAWDGDGTPVPGFPAMPTTNSWNHVNEAMPYPVVLADYDNDSLVEIMVVHRGSFGIASIHGNGVQADDPELVTRYSLLSSPVVDDIDSDGMLEIIIGGTASESLDANGAVYIWDVLGPSNSALPWPMFRRDMQRNAVVELLPELESPDELRIFHDIDAGNTATTSMVISNKGGGEIQWQLETSSPQITVDPTSGTLTKEAILEVSVVLTSVTASGTSKTAWLPAGTITATGTFEGQSVSGSPRTTMVYVYVADLHNIFLPVILRDISY